MLSGVKNGVCFQPYIHHNVGIRNNFQMIFTQKGPDPRYASISHLRRHNQESTHSESFEHNQ